MPTNDPAAADGLGGLRAELREREFTTISSLSMADPRAASLLGASGCDVVMIDAEHNPFTLPEIGRCLDAIALTPARAIVRVAGHDPALIKQALDLGPDGILVPMVGTAEEARAAVAACRYPPDGIRGFGMARAQGYGLTAGEYLESANSTVAALIIVESAEGVANARAIAATDGLDGILVGPGDLGVDLGVGGDTGHPAVQAGVDAIVAAANDAGVAAGSVAAPEDLREKLDRGQRLLVTYVDFRGMLAAAREVYRQVDAERERRRAAAGG